MKGKRMPELSSEATADLTKRTNSMHTTIAREVQGSIALAWHRGKHSGIHEAATWLQKHGFVHASNALRKSYGMDREGNIGHLAPEAGP